ncbi:hypothetical protein Tco_1243809 [Tanacetum coccineum]
MGPVLSAWSRSAIKSSTSSIPTEIRTKSSVIPLALRTSAGMTECDMKLGNVMSDFTVPVAKGKTIDTMSYGTHAQKVWLAIELLECVNRKATSYVKK